MQLTNQKYQQKIDSSARQIAEKVKNIVIRYDINAVVILFGSRARGDAAEESDWDFLVLTNKQDIEKLAATLRREIRLEVESQFNIAISLMVKNRRVWEEDYAVTNIYESIAEEGIVL